MEKKFIAMLVCVALMGCIFVSAQDICKTVANVPMVQLNNGVLMPQFGLGNHPVLYVNNRALLLWRSVIDISILLMHNDEAGVGRAVKESGISREKIWITSKLWPTEYGESKTLEAIDKILEHMQLDLFTSQPAILWVHGVIWEKYVHWESVISMQMTRRSRKLWSNRV